MVDKLEINQIFTLLDEKKDWHVDENGAFIEKIWEFNSFPMAFSFMTRIAFLCEAQQHYVEWSNAKGRVFIRLTTHECEGVTLKDIDFAKQIDSILMD